jgi:hypothetical protein
VAKEDFDTYLIIYLTNQEAQKYHVLYTNKSFYR